MIPVFAIKKVENAQEKTDSGVYVNGAKGKYFISSANIVNCMGSGTFGTIYLASDEQNNSIAIKKISKSGNTLPASKIIKELEILHELGTISLCNLVPSIDEVEDDEFFYVMMPCYKKGTLTKIIDTRQIQSELYCIELLRQLVYGLNKLHSKNIIHRDLKTDNIFAEADPNYQFEYYLAIGDFGLAREENKSDMTMNVGTKYTQAPEVESEKYDTKADIYSIGCIFYKMLTFKEPFSGNTMKNISDLKKAKILEVKSKFGQLSMLTLNTLQGCLQFDPAKRFDSNELSTILSVNEELYTSYKPLDLGEKGIKNIICINPQLDEPKQPPMKEDNEKKYEVPKDEESQVQISESIVAPMPEKPKNNVDEPKKIKDSVPVKPENNVREFDDDHKIVEVIVVPSKEKKGKEISINIVGGQVSTENTKLQSPPEKAQQSINNSNSASTHLIYTNVPKPMPPSNDSNVSNTSSMQDVYRVKANSDLENNKIPLIPKSPDSNQGIRNMSHIVIEIIFVVLVIVIIVVNICYPNK